MSATDDSSLLSSKNPIPSCAEPPPPLCGLHEPIPGNPSSLRTLRTSLFRIASAADFPDTLPYGRTTERAGREGGFVQRRCSRSDGAHAQSVISDRHSAIASATPLEC
jgi:hypothetical protein